MITGDGQNVRFYMNPHGGRADPNPNYVGKSRMKCKKDYGKECFVFAAGNRIVWQNGINKKGKITKKAAIAGKTLEILQELGFIHSAPVNIIRRIPSASLLISIKLSNPSLLSIFAITFTG